MGAIGWLVLLIALLVVELATMGLTTVWFAGGAFVSFIASLLGAGFLVQLYLFIGVSLVLLLFTRPAVKKYLNQKTVKTNAEGLVGQVAVVTQRIENRAEQGAAILNGQPWTARAASDEEVLEVGQEVQVLEIRGVKLIVTKKNGGSEA